MDPESIDRGVFSQATLAEADVYPSLTQLVNQLSTTHGERKDIPIVFIPGFAGWGEPLFKFFNYFGGFFNTMQALVDDGWHVICPHLGPISSNWERACEVYAQLTKIGRNAGYVDYGPTFANDPSNPYRTRQGRYTEGVMKSPNGVTVSGISPDWKWDANHPVHFVCHSQGGNTVRFLIHLLENGGVPDTYFERPVDGAGLWVRSVTTLATPYNGTTVLDVVDELGGPMYDIVRQTIITAQHPAPEDRFFDLKLDHWGICRNSPTEDYTAYCLRQAQPNGPYTLWRNSEWHGFYDNSISGIATRLAGINPSRNVFYFTLATGCTIDLSLTKGFEREYEHLLRGRNEQRMIEDIQSILTGGFKHDSKRMQDEFMGYVKGYAPKVMDTAHKLGQHLPAGLKASIGKHAAGLSQKLPPSLQQYAAPYGQQYNTQAAGAQAGAPSGQDPYQQGQYSTGQQQQGQYNTGQQQQPGQYNTGQQQQANAPGGWNPTTGTQPGATGHETWNPTSPPPSATSGTWAPPVTPASPPAAAQGWLPMSSHTPASATTTTPTPSAPAGWTSMSAPSQAAQGPAPTGTQWEPSSQSASATGPGANTNPATAFTTTQSFKDKLLPRLDILPLFALTAYKMGNYDLKSHQRAEVVECYPDREAGFEGSAAWWQNDGVVNTVSMAGPRNQNVLHWGGAVTGVTPGVYTYLGVNETLDHADVLGISGNVIKSEKVVLTYRMIGRLLSHL